MKITMFSNFMNHHQLPVCTWLDKLTGGNFTFVAHQPVPQERLSMGYYDLNKSVSFVRTSYDGDVSMEDIHRLYIDSDIVITGSSPDYFLAQRLDMGKITFRYSERAYKTGLWKAFTPNDAIYMGKMHGIYRDKPLYMLCASGYTPYDMSIHHLYKDKTFKWGYFPESYSIDLDTVMSKKNTGKIKILWAGRLIPLKHPEVAVKVAKRLKDCGCNFEMCIIGNGELFDPIKKSVSENGLDSFVTMTGFLSPEKVRDYMLESDIFMFTSNFVEGWGAVMNEAMDSACACVVSHAVGSTAFLINHGTNGLVYKFNDAEDCFEKVKFLIDNPEKRMAMGKKAYHTIHDMWSPETAAKNLVSLCNALLNGADESPVAEGPCSRAEIVKQKNMYEYLTKGKEL